MNNKIKEEIWKKINNYSDYEISNFGRIKSFKQDSINGKILSRKDTDGYHIIGLARNKKRKTERIHRLVLETFNPVKNINNLKVNHKNGIKDDNRFPENIEWCTQSENEKHAHKIGLKNFKGNKAFSRGCGEDNPFYGVKHSEKTKQKIREKSRNNNYRSLCWNITIPNGDIIKINNLKKFCRENNLNYHSVFSSVKNNRNYKNYLFERIEK